MLSLTITTQILLKMRRYLLQHLEYSFADGKLKEVIKNHTRSDNIGNEYDIEVTMGAQNNPTSNFNIW